MRLAAAQLSIAERLDRVSLILEPGTITAICGPNGAGKSSLLEALAGLLPAGDGAVFLDRQQIAALPETCGYCSTVMTRGRCGSGSSFWRRVRMSTRRYST